MQNLFSRPPDQHLCHLAAVIRRTAQVARVAERLYGPGRCLQIPGGKRGFRFGQKIKRKTQPMRLSFFTQKIR